MIHVFIIRPFGTKNGIDFDRVERELIQPAMMAAGMTGGTTGELIEQGNIRVDMFEELLIADLVIADVSIHNANAFYELGIRHAFCDKRTFLIKSKGEEVPFDLKTDRYFSYDAANPGANVDGLAKALKATLDSQNADSPIFQLLPELEPAERNKYLRVPIDFRESVESAEAKKQCADLQLFAAELGGFAWREAGLRLIGNGQFRLQDWPGAKATWLAVRDYNDMDRQANMLLGTIFQRLGDLVSSDQAVERALQNRGISAHDRAETRALMGRNAKTDWAQEWGKLGELEAMQESALSSPFLEKSFEYYRQGFVEDRNHLYSGLNALALVSIQTELAQLQSAVWEDGFDSKAEADQKLSALKTMRVDLAAGVKLAIESRNFTLQRRGESDVWADIGAADLVFLTSSRPNRVGQAYKKALAEATDQARESVRRQISLYQRLGILKDNAAAALNELPARELAAQVFQGAPRVILFTGHRVDAPERAAARFPAAKAVLARDMIYSTVKQEKEKTNGKLLGISGGAAGGDIIFHEVCEELGIPSEMYLILPKAEYIKASVAEGGPGWVERFNRLCEKLKPQILSDSEELPRWLRAKKDYGIWQRSNLWTLHRALYASEDHLTLIALWNGAAGDGPGGTEDMVNRAKDRGATFIRLDARKLIE